jgi:hypothetical protein
MVAVLPQLDLVAVQLHLRGLEPALLGHALGQFQCQQGHHADLGGRPRFAAAAPRLGPQCEGLAGCQAEVSGRVAHEAFLVVAGPLHGAHPFAAQPDDGIAHAGRGRRAQQPGGTVGVRSSGWEWQREMIDGHDFRARLGTQPAHQGLHDVVRRYLALQVADAVDDADDTVGAQQRLQPGQQALQQLRHRRVRHAPQQVARDAQGFGRELLLRLRLQFGQP